MSKVDGVKIEKGDQTAPGKRGGGRGRPFRAPQPQATKFVGACDALKGYIYDVSGGGRQTDQFHRTHKRLVGYAGDVCDYPQDIMETLETGKMKTFAMPADLTEEEQKSYSKKFRFEKEATEVLRHESKLKDSCAKIYATSYGQCTEAMKARLRSHSNWESVSKMYDVLSVLESIKKITYDFQGQKQDVVSLYMSNRTMYTYRQQPGQTNADLHEKFTAIAEVIEANGGKIGREPSMLNAEAVRAGATDFESASLDIKEAAQAICQTKYLAIALLVAADRGRYASLLEELENDNTKGKDNYPTTMAGTLNLLMNYKGSSKQNQPVPGTGGLTFYQAMDEDDGIAQANISDGGRRDFSKRRCYECGKIGHIGADCQVRKAREAAEKASDSGGDTQEEGDNHAIVTSSGSSTKNGFWEDYTETDGFGFYQAHERVPKTWLLLDSQSTCDIFGNPELLTNIRSANGRSIKIHSNGGTMVVDQVGDFKNYGTVWYSNKAIANILSLSKVKKQYPIRYDSVGGNQFVVSTPRHDIIFSESDRGLYYHDTDNRAIVLVNTVQENREGFTDREYDAAVQARRALALVGYPSPKDFEGMVRSNLIRNCPVQPRDISVAHKIFGPDVASLKGKTVRRRPEPVVSEYVHVPREILALNNEVEVAADVLFVNGYPFLLSVSRKIKFMTVEYLPRHCEEDLASSIRKIVKLYEKRGFKITQFYMDHEFECLKGRLSNEVPINTTAKSDHFPEIERPVRVVKERARAIYSTLPFTKVPGRIIVALLTYVVTWLNAFPPKNGISRTYSPRTILTGKTLDFEKHCKLPFGSYAQTFEDNDPSNTMDARMAASICLGPTTNFQGSYKFLHIGTGRTVTRRQWTELAMPNWAIDRVNALAQKEKSEGGLVFADRTNTLFDAYPELDGIAGVDLPNDNEEGHIEDEDTEIEDEANEQRDAEIEDEENEQPPDSNEDVPFDPNNEPEPREHHANEVDGANGITPRVDDNIGTTGVVPGTVKEDPGTNEPNADDAIGESTEVAGETAGDRETATEIPAQMGETNIDHTDHDASDDQSGDEADDGAMEVPDEEVFHPNSTTPSVRRTYNLRTNRSGRDYSHRYGHHMSHVIHHAMTQYSLPKGVKRFGER